MDYQAEVLSWRRKYQEKSPDIAPRNQLLEDHVKDKSASPVGSSTRVRVCCKLRPLLQQGQQIGRPIQSLAKASSNTPVYEYEAVSCDPSGCDNTDVACAGSTVFVHQEQSYIGECTGRVETTAYRLDHVLPAQTDTDHLFHEAIVPALSTVLTTPQAADMSGSAGLWCISFGMTGSGKTHTSQEYLMLTAQRLLLAAQSSGCELVVSMVEIRGNECFDLMKLNNDCAEQRLPRIAIREDAHGRVRVSSSQWLLTCDNDVASCLSAFRTQRATAATTLNEESSRSHAVITLSFSTVDEGGINASASKDKVSDEEGELDRCLIPTKPAGHTLQEWNGPSLRAVCRIVDLAGSERQR